MKALLVGTYNAKKDPISYAQLYPFFENRHKLEQELSFGFDHQEAATFQEIDIILKTPEDLDSYDMLLIRPTWRHTRKEAIEFFLRVRQNFPRQKIFLIDPWDQVTGRYLCVAPYVDRIIKYQGLSDPSMYAKKYIGGTIVSDYLARRQGYDIGDWDVGSEVPLEYLDRISPGWNIATVPRFKKQIFRSPISKILDIRKRDIDIFCRVSYGRKNNLEWYGQYRIEAIENLKALESNYKLAVSGEFAEEKTISSRQYFRDIRRSKIAFSPFGWGEITWRDYEAVAYGCLLVKPCVDHLTTYPDIFHPGETYVPVEWDFSDLEEKCRYYLDHWGEAKGIIENARQAYRVFFEKNEFIELIRPLL